MTTTDTTTIEPLKMTKLRVQVLAGIAAGEVRRVKIGNKHQIQWYKKDGHELGWGRTHGKVFTRWPTHTVNQLVDAGLAAYSTRFPDHVKLTSAGKKLLFLAAARPGVALPHRR